MIPLNGANAEKGPGSYEQDAQEHEWREFDATG